MFLRLLLACLLLLLAAAPPAQAGAWPRGKGNHFAFAALRAIGSETGELTPSFSYYHEYGLTDRLTVSADLGGAISGFDKTVVALSMPLPLPEFLGLKAGVQLGYGEIAGQQVMRPGLSLGRGFAHPQGWASVDLVAEIFPDLLAIDWKVDLTLGLTSQHGHKYYLQWQTGQQMGDPVFSRLEGSVAWQLRDGLFLDVGAAAGLAATDPYRVKLGLWREF